MPKLYGWVREVVPESAADLAGIQSGDLLKTINGNPIRDLVDYQFYASDEEVLLGIERNGRAIDVLVAKEPGAEMGIRFGEEPAPFIRICANKCIFCFIDGLPKRNQPQRGLPLGMRDTLYVKDDDYRYSFMFGNFVTLTNLKELDWKRLEEQRLSPLYVSVHTTNPDLRRKMVDGPRAGDILAQIQRIGSLGITCHTQLVLCPGINDGDELERSIRDLTALRPIVESISVVPVGLTKYNNLLKTGELPPMRPFRLDEARDVMARVERWQRQFATEPGAHGLPFVYLSDEWYYNTNQPFPPARHYGDYAQIENGVGMTRKLVEDWRVAKRTLPTALEQPRKVAILTSAMAAPIITKLARDLRAIAGLDVRVLPVTNVFFGPIVTAAGLLCGQDVLDEIARSCPDFTPDDLLLLPRVMLDNAGKRFLDDVTIEDFIARAPGRVVFARDAAALAAAVCTLAPAPEPTAAG
ncbi:MAG: Fe-S oxidoreductase, related to NifB/MoaA family with PDZ N-terminal domain [Ktedonobacterales bacterium]|jgi:putative radical SAM enzyme (TIGR03279 family)|nr:MAG: Fe-S oxidoreductase, related to NifB/MoaA family with PDZ N-terminal domain [Ktedonobacterales bacterium]